MSHIQTENNNDQSERHNHTVAFKNAGFDPDAKDGYLFSFDFEKSLGYNIGEQFYECIPSLRELVVRLKEKNALSYDNKIERNGVDGYIWLEKEENKLLIVGFENQNITYLVYIINNFGKDEIHVRQIWKDYLLSCRSGHYMIGTPSWNEIKNPSYKDVICHAKTALEEYSDDFYDEKGHRLPSDGHYVKRPCLKTHQEKINNVGMRCQDCRDAGYIVSVTIDVLTEKPYCDSPYKSMQSPIHYLFMDFKSVLNYPCLEGDEF